MHHDLNGPNIDIRSSGLSGRLTDVRIDQGLTRAELADKAGLSERTVRLIEQGQRDRIQQKTLLLLAEALGITYHELLSTGLQASSAATSGVESPDPPPSSFSRQPGTSPRRFPADLAPTRRRSFPLSAVVLIGLATILVAAFWIFDRSSPSVHKTASGIVARSSLLDRILWRRDFAASVVFIERSPWGDDTVLLGLKANAEDGGKICLIDRATGSVLWERKPDVDQVATAFGPSRLGDNRGFTAERCCPVDLDGDGDSELAVNFMHALNSPACVLLLTRRGEVRGQYNHRGHFYDLLAVDLDADGKQELLVAGTNNAECYQGATVVLLDDLCHHGAALDSLYHPSTSLPDSCRYRLILPTFGAVTTDLLGARRIAADGLTVTRSLDGELRITVIVGVDRCGVHVTLDPNLRPLKVTPTDGLIVRARQEEGSVQLPDGFPHPFWFEEWLKGAVHLAAGHWPPPDGGDWSTRR